MNASTRLPIFAALLSLLIMVGGCALPLDSGGGDPGGMIQGEAQITQIEIFMLESFPVQVNAALRGFLPDGCTTLGDTSITRTNNTFTIVVATSRPADAVCTEATMSFEQTIALDVVGLPAGEYIVVAGNVSAAFILQVDNVLPDLETPTLPPSSSIQGRVWHDLCAIAGGEGGEPAGPSAGCIDKGDGAFAADGVMTPDEPGIEGIEVQLLQGSCDGAVVGSILTNADGEFGFDGLAAGMYCVLIDPLANPNSSILIPGEWTSVAQGSALIDLMDGQTLTALNFGWDYQFLPEPGDVSTPTPTPEPEGTSQPNDPGCTNRAKFVSETIEDDTVVAAGSSFTKTWVLENTGTCRWEKEYTVVFDSGDRMGGAESTPLPVKIPPGEQLTFSIQFTAPSIAGTYRGNWMLQTDSGAKFGLGTNNNQPFWVQVKVEGTVVDLDLGAAAWTDNFDTGANWFLLDTDAVRFSIVEGQMRLRAKIAGAGDLWGLSNRPALEDFYLEALFKTGDTCVGLDRYGLLVRSPNPNAGYVFNVSCNGQFRVYEWNGSVYNQLKGWTASTAIKSGPNATNQVGVWADGDTLRLYINDILVTELSVSIYDEGQFGLLVGSTNTANFDVFVDQISYWILDN